MATMKAKYLGQLRVECEHVASGTKMMRIEGRPYTTIERNLIERMIHVILSDLSAASW